MKCIFLYNPNSGKGKILKHLGYIESCLHQKYEEVTMYATKSGEDTMNQATNSCSKYDAIIFAGGDGTFNDVACGVSSCCHRPVLGYIPSGTVNDIARNLGISRNIKKAIKTIIEGHTVTHDVGTINERFFMYVSAIGTFTNVSYRTKQRTKKMFGSLAYAFAGLKDIVNPKCVNVKLTTETNTYEMETPLVLVLNSISVGGIPFNKNGHLNDGKFDIVIVKKSLVSRGLVNIAHLFAFGIGKRRINGHFLCIKSSDFKMEVADNITWCVDGEEGMKGSVEIHNLHNHLRIFVPMKKNQPKSKNVLLNDDKSDRI